MGAAQSAYDQGATTDMGMRPRQPQPQKRTAVVVANKIGGSSFPMPFEPPVSRPAVEAKPVFGLDPNALPTDGVWGRPDFKRPTIDRPAVPPREEFKRPVIGRNRPDWRGGAGDAREPPKFAVERPPFYQPPIMDTIKPAFSGAAGFGAGITPMTSSVS